MSLIADRLLANAFHSNYPNRVRLALALGADPNQKFRDKPLLLDGIARGIQPTTIEALLNSTRIDINVTDSEGIGALFYALAFNREVIPLLLNARIDPNSAFVEDNFNALLLVFTDPVNIPPTFSVSIGSSFPALDHAVQTWVTKLLIEAQADVNSATSDGYTALHGALLLKNQEAILALLAAGANKFVANAHNYTPLAYALKNLGQARNNSRLVSEAVQVLNIILDKDIKAHTDYPPSVLRITMETALQSLNESPVPEEKLVIAQTYRIASRLLLINNALNAAVKNNYYYAQLARFIALDLIYICRRMFSSFKTLPPELIRMFVQTLLGDMTSSNGSSDVSVLHAYKDYRDSLVPQQPAAEQSTIGKNRMII